MTDRLMGIISARNPLAQQAASALCKLIVEAGHLGELPTRERRMPDGATRTVKYLPPEWCERLADAAERGAFARYSIERIVQHILSHPAETAP